MEKWKRHICRRNCNI